MKSWAKATLDQVCSLVTDGTHHSPSNFTSGTYRYVTAKNIRPWGLDLSNLTYVDSATHQEIYARCPVEYGDVLYIKDGVTTGLAAINTLTEPFSMLSSVALLKPRKGLIHPPYLKHWLNSPLTKREMTSGMTGTAIKRLVLKQIRAAEIPLAPIAEQKRIADKLDTVLTRVDAVNTRLARVASILKRFRQSALESLTQVAAPACELRTLLQFVRTGPFGSALHKSDYVRGGTPIVNPMHIIDRQIRPSVEMTVPTEVAQRLADFQLVPDDIVIGRRGAMGRCAVVTAEQAGWLCGTGSMVLRPKSGIDPHFLQLALSRQSSVRALEGDAVGSTMVNLNQSILLALQVSCPLMAEQTEIVRRVETLFALADRLEARLQAAQTATERLTPALLAKAFRGELVPQDPNDEPASELLRRLAQQGDPKSTKPQRGRKAAASSA